MFVNGVGSGSKRSENSGGQAGENNLCSFAARKVARGGLGLQNGKLG